MKNVDIEKLTTKVIERLLGMNEEEVNSYVVEEGLEWDIKETIQATLKVLRDMEGENNEDMG